MSDLCLIGTIVGLHGVRGGLKVQSHSDIPGRFERLESVLIGPDAEQVRRVTIVDVSEDGFRIVLTLKEYSDRTAAEELVGEQLFVTDDQMEKPPEGRYFVHELIGCRVITPGGEDLGDLRDVMLMPANDVYVVLHRGQDVLVPAVPEFIKSVDIGKKTVVVEPIPGLFEVPDED